MVNNTAMLGLFDGGEVVGICLQIDAGPDKIGELLLTQLTDPHRLEKLLLGIDPGDPAAVTLAACRPGPNPAGALIYDDLDKYLTWAWEEFGADWAYLLVEGRWYVYTASGCYQLEIGELVPVAGPVTQCDADDRFAEGNDDRCFVCDRPLEDCEGHDDEEETPKFGPKLERLFLSIDRSATSDDSCSDVWELTACLIPTENDALFDLLAENRWLMGEVFGVEDIRAGDADLGCVVAICVREEFMDRLFGVAAWTQEVYG